MDTCSGAAINDAELYKNIIEHRKKFYHLSSVDYESDKREQIKIWPIGEIEQLFKEDYNAMIESFIYNENPLTFVQLKERILELEAKFRNDV
jgi:hypothetical protein